VFSTVVLLKDIKTDEWSADKSRHDFALRQCFGIPFYNTKVDQVWHFFLYQLASTWVRRKVREIIGFQSHEMLSAPWCDQPRSPSQMFCVLVVCSNKVL
jgi:hypothetical protein